MDDADLRSLNIRRTEPIFIAEVARMPCPVTEDDSESFSRNVRRLPYCN